MTRPRSLADELSELVNPAPQAELDPEAAGIAEGDQLGGSDDELAGLVGQAARGRRAIAADIAIEGGEYRGRRSSRAALFGGDEEQQGDGSLAAGGSSDSDSDDGGEGNDEQLLGVGVRLARHVQGLLPPGRMDLSAIPTMFANGHMNGPGRDDPTSSSSLFSDEGEEEDEDTEQQLLQQQAGAAAVPAQQQAAAAAAGEDQAQAGERQQEEQDESDGAGSGSSSSGEDGTSSEQDEQAEQQKQQLLQDAAEGSSSEAEEGEEGSQEEQEAVAAAVDTDTGEESDKEEDGDDADGDIEQLPEAAGRLDVAAAAAAGVTAMLGDDEEMQQLEREAAAAQAEAAQQLVSASARSSRDAEKAAGVRAQQRLWGAALELRIRLQKALAGANLLPRPGPRALLAAHNQQVAHSYCGLLVSCQSTLQHMLQLHHTLAQQHPAAAAALAAAEAAQQQQQQQQHGKGQRSRAAAGVDAGAEQQQAAAVGPARYAGSCRSAAEAWAAVDASITALSGFRDASLDKWHRRTVLSSGTAALRGSSGLRALQQSVSSQVAALMADRAKLVARSQLPLELAPRALGTPAAAAAAVAPCQAGDSEDDADGDGDGARRTAGGGGRRRERARDAETYDEGDFYQQLLKELLDSAPPGSLPQQLAGARPPKRRKLVDRRASKGRKIRYHTMDKLVGFMAPCELVAPPFAEQLFGNLFSHEG